MRITDIRAYVRADRQENQILNQQAPPIEEVSEKTPWNERPIASPLSTFSGYEVRTVGGPAWVGYVVVEVESDTGIIGTGVSVGGPAACWVIEDHLSPLLLGQQFHHPEDLWDYMWRGTQFYGRKGLVIHAISAVDLALWDLFGRTKGESVMDLLGGPLKETLKFYATTPDAEAAQLLGFAGCKLPLTYGPAAGEKGLIKNIELFANARQAVGEDFFLAYDCWMALDVAYAARLGRELSPYRPAWLEECLIPDDMRGLRRLRDLLPDDIALAGGEHEATRWGFEALLDAGSLQLLQPDPTWCGGLSELRRIAAIAQTAEVPIICHGAGPYSLHASAAIPGIPMAECILGTGSGGEITPFFGDLFEEEILPEEGKLETRLLKRPGFGVEINPDIELIRPTRSNRLRKEF